MARTSRALTCRDSKAPKPVRTTRSPAANDSRMLSSTAFSARSPEERVPLSLVATRKARSPFRSVANRYLLSDGAKSRAKPYRLREYSTRNRVQYAQRYLCTGTYVLVPMYLLSTVSLPGDPSIRGSGSAGRARSRWGRRGPCWAEQNPRAHDGSGDGCHRGESASGVARGDEILDGETPCPRIGDAKNRHGGHGYDCGPECPCSCGRPSFNNEWPLQWWEWPFRCRLPSSSSPSTGITQVRF